MKKVAVIMGGKGSEHDVSINSGMQVLKNLDREKYEPLKVVIQKNGLWEVGDVLCPFTGGLEELLAQEVDVAFLALHGTWGEDGTIQGVLEYAGIPYTGSDGIASGVAIDKQLSRQLFHLHGIRVPSGLVVTISNWEKSIQLIERTCGYPCVVKPLRDGSSVGVEIVPDVFALTRILQHSSHQTLLAEAKIEGVEVTGGVLDIPGNPVPQALPPTQIIPKEAAFFDYHSKYTPGATEEITPPNLSPEIVQNIQEIALQCHGILGCKGISRTDMIVANDGIYVLETNTLPGMTETSLLPQQAQAIGMTFSSMITAIIEGALEENEAPQAPVSE